MIGVWPAGRFVAYQKTTRAIAIRTTAAMATLGRLRGLASVSSLLRGELGTAVFGAALRCAERPVTGAAAALTGAAGEGLVAPAFVTVGALSTRRIAASEALLPAPARTTVANGAGSCSASRSLEKRRPVSAL